MLNQDQQDKLVEVVNEELKEMGLYKYLALSEVFVVNVDGYDVYIKVMDEDYVPSEVEDDE